MQNRMLSEYRLFAGLSEEECQAVLGCIGGWESPAQKGELLAHAGEELAAMGLVLEGRVDILSTDYWGSETLMARLGPLVRRLTGESGSADRQNAAKKIVEKAK